MNAQCATRSLKRYSIANLFAVGNARIGFGIAKVIGTHPHLLANHVDTRLVMMVQMMTSGAIVILVFMNKLKRL